MKFIDPGLKVLRDTDRLAGRLDVKTASCNRRSIHLGYVIRINDDDILTLD